MGWRLTALLVALMLCVAAIPAGAEEPAFVDVYVSGEDGYDTYRIPAMVVTNEGTLLAFAEGRKHSRSDSGDIDMLVKRSEDGGSTWSEQQVVWDDGGNTCGNPCPVVDRETGTVWLVMTHNPGDYHEFDDGTFKGTRTVWVTHSEDDGRTWAEPREITETTKGESWEWYATGPGVGIQLERGEHAGRLVIPANHSHKSSGEHAIRSEGRYGLGAHAVVSDDGGKTWRKSREAIRPRMNETQMVELSDGRVMANMRAYFKDGFRYTATSDDGGETWTDPRPEEQLVEPVCQASILRYDWPDGDRPGRILFSNPATKSKRRAMTVRLSRDDGQSWPVSRLLYEGSSAYSCLVKLPDGRAGCFFERDGYGAMTLATFSLEWLTGEGED